MKGWKIFILAIVLYGVSVFGGFVQDDTKVIMADPEMGEVSSLLNSFVRPYYYMDGGNSGAYRPLTSFSLYLNALVTGKGAWGFHLMNIFLYAGVCWLVFEVLKKYTSEKLAFWSSIVFVVLPIHTEAVNNIVGRAEILSLGFVIVAILLQYKKKWEMSAVIFLLALLSKETAIVGLPILIYMMVIGKEKTDIKIGVSSFYVLVAVCFVVLRLVVLGNGVMGNSATIVENPLKSVTTSQRVMNAFSLVPFGVGKILFPLNLSYDYSFNQLKLVTSWFDWRVILGIVMMMFSCIYLYRFRIKYGMTLFVIGMMMFWGPLAITGNILFPIGTIFGERLWFWSSLGMVMMGMSWINLYRLPRRFHLLAMTTLILIIVLFLGRTFVRNLDWLSQERLFIHDAIYAKDSVMAQSNAAAMYLIKKDLVKGKEYLEKAEIIYPTYPELMNNWGMYYLWTGELKTAKEKFEFCLKEKPGFYLCEGNVKLIKDGIE